MAKKMQFSVVGLPHYTIWHLYEPSVDDIRQMEVRGRPALSVRMTGDDWLTCTQQMERERLAQEQAEKEAAERAQKMKESFDDATGQWEKDKAELQNIAMQDLKKEAAAVVAAAAGAAKEESDANAAAGETQEQPAGDAQAPGGAPEEENTVAGGDQLADGKT